MISKMSCVVLLLAAVCVSQVFSAPQYSQSGGSSSNQPVQYNFNWLVRHQQSGNNFGHQEQRNGPNTQGSYFVNLPDGRIQRVNYYVSGNSGFVAQVTYEGEAVYPQTPSQKY